MPPAALCRRDGSVYDGQVRVTLVLLDACDPAALRLMPGDFTAMDKYGKAGQLGTFGVISQLEPPAFRQNA